MSRIVTQAKNGYLQEVIKLLHEGHSVDERDADNATALYWSACLGYPDICKVLLESSSEVDTKVRWGSTPLHAAADRGQIDCVKILIDGKAGVNCQNDRGDTALHVACYRGFVEIVRMLIKARADPFIKNNNKKTALQEAHSQSYERVVDILLYYEEEFNKSKHQQAAKRKLLKSTHWTSHPTKNYPNNLSSSSFSHFTRNLSDCSSGLTNYTSNESSDSMMSESMLTSSSDMFAFNQGSVSRMPLENYSAGMKNEISQETMESFAEALQFDLTLCKDEICRLQSDKEKVAEQMQECLTSNQALNVRAQKAEQALIEERKAKQELLRRSHINQSELSKRVSDAETKSLTMSMKSSAPTRCEMKLCHQTILELLKSRNIRTDMSKLCDKVHQLWQCTDRNDSLKLKPREWILDQDFAVVGDMPINHFGAGKRDGACSLVFRINYNSNFYMLKMMINLINLEFTCHGSGNSIDNYLVDNFGPEYLVPLLFSNHPNIIRVLHHYQGSTDGFKKYESLLVPKNFDVPIEMANRTTFLVLMEYPFTLKSFMLQQKQMHPNSLYGLTEEFILQFFYQLLSSLVFLQSKKIVHRDIKADNIMIDYNLRPVLGDFGFARCLNDNYGRPKRFVEEMQSTAGNSHAWAPELCRYSRCPPKNLPHTVLLEDIFCKSDGFATARMIYSILQPIDSEDTFPTSSPNVPHYENSRIPELPTQLSPEFRTILRDLVLNDPIDRPTVKEAMFRIGGLIFSPSIEEVNSFEDMIKYHEARLLSMSTIDSKSWQEVNRKEVVTIEDSIKTNSLEIEAHFLTHITSQEFWEICQKRRTSCSKRH